LRKRNPTHRLSRRWGRTRSASKPSAMIDVPGPDRDAARQRMYGVFAFGASQQMTVPERAARLRARWTSSTLRGPIPDDTASGHVPRASDRSVTRRVDPRPARRWPTIAAWCRVGDHDRSMYRLRPDLWCPRPRWLTRSTTAGGGRRRPRAPVGSGEAGESQRSDPDVPNCEEPAATQRGLFCARIVDEFAWALPAGDQAAVTTRMSRTVPVRRRPAGGARRRWWTHPIPWWGPLCPR